MIMNSFHPAETIGYEHSADAPLTKQYTFQPASLSLIDQVRLALSKLLISWGARLYVPPRASH